jgi:hypothetical protein
MADRSNDNPQDPAQMSLGGIVTNLPAVSGEEGQKRQIASRL